MVYLILTLQTSNGFSFALGRVILSSANILVLEFVKHDGRTEVGLALL